MVHNRTDELTETGSMPTTVTSSHHTTAPARRRGSGLKVHS